MRRIAHNQLPQIFHSDKIFLRHCLEIIVPLHLLGKSAKLPRDLPVELRLLLRILHMELTLQDPDLKEKAVLRLADALFKRLTSQRFHKFIRILVGLHIDDSTGQSSLPQNADAPQRRLDSGTVAVVGQQHIVCIPPKRRLLRCESSPQGCHRLPEARLMHGDHIHITLAENDVGAPGPSGIIEPVQIPPLVKYRGLGRV